MLRIDKLSQAINTALIAMASAPIPKAAEEVEGPDASDGHDCEGFPGGCERFGCPGGLACPMLRKLTANERAKVLRGEMEIPPGAVMPVKLPKRVRVRSPKLYACDIEPGGVYVPKRGNDKTPNYYVVMVEEGSDGWPVRCWWRRSAVSDATVNPSVSTADEFLALVARRVGA